MVKSFGVVRNIFSGKTLKEQAVELVATVTGRFDTDHIKYLVSRNIRLVDLMPEPLWSAQAAWLSRYVLLAALSADDILEAAIEARPDCADILRSEAGRRWLSEMLRIA